MNAPSSALDLALARYARLVVALTLVLIFIGGLVTSWQAGMAVPDWPLSFGSLNPEGWWADMPVRLEHGHRLFAMGVGFATAILCAWIWRNGWAFLAAVVLSAALPPLAAMAGASKPLIMHLAIWPPAVVFALILLFARGSTNARPRTVRWLAFAAFVCVCIQATLGGLRVTRETAGAIDVALILRVVHGCVAQAFLCILVAIAFLVSTRRPPAPAENEATRPWSRWLAWLAVGTVYLQLIVGAVMRHLGAGLAIPTFPQAAPDGSWWPAAHNRFVDINFAHTRFGALIVTVLVILAAGAAIRFARGRSYFSRPAIGMLVLLGVQVALGLFVIWHQKPRTLATLHVVNGAALLATALLLALRLGHSQRAALSRPPAAARSPVEISV